MLTLRGNDTGLEDECLPSRQSREMYSRQGAQIEHMTVFWGESELKAFFPCLRFEGQRLSPCLSVITTELKVPPCREASLPCSCRRFSLSGIAFSRAYPRLFLFWRKKLKPRRIKPGGPYSELVAAWTRDRIPN